MVHRLGHKDSEQLRCDISKEISSWKGVVDFHAAAAFVFGLHDMWSQVLLHENGATPWWHGNQVVSLPDMERSHRRRLEEESEKSAAVGEAKGEPVVTTEAENEFDEDGEDEEDLEDVHHFDHNGFGVTRKSVGAASGEGRESIKKDDDDKQELPGDDDKESEPAGVEMEELDPSKYDTWLGVLSSSSTNMFVRLVDPQLVGAVFLDEHESATIA